MHRVLRLPFALLLGLSACKGAGDADADADADTDSDTDTDTDTDSDTDSDADADSDTEPTGDTGQDCVDDPNEPNDVHTAALPLPTPAANLVACSSSPDWWELEVQPSEIIALTVSHVNADGDLDSELVDAAGVVLDVSTTFADEEVVTWFNAGASPAIVRLGVAVWTGSTSSRNTYEVLEFRSNCQDDANEPNDDLGSAAPLVDGLGFGLTQSSDDYWTLSVPAGDLLEVAVLFDHGLGDIDVELFDASGVLVDISGTTADLESVRWYNPAAIAQTMVLHVEFWDTTPCSTYEIQHTLTAVSCNEDPFEDNDTLADAQITTSVSALGVRQGDDDWWAIDAPDGMLTQVEVVFDPASVEVLLSLHDGNGAPIGTSGNPGVVLNTTGVDSTIYAQVQVDPNGPGVCGDYDLMVTDETPTCDQDSAEPNDNDGEAFAVGTGAAPYVLGDADLDYFAVEIEADHELRAHVQYPTVLGGLELVLLSGGAVVDSDPFGPELDVAFSNRTGSAVSHLVRVEQSSSLPLTCVPYVLSIEDRDCSPDDTEPNDSLAGALPLVVPASDLYINNDNEDFWMLGVVATGQSISAVVEFLDSDGDIDLELLDVNGVTLDTSGGIENIEEVVWTNAGAGVAVVLRVHTFGTDATCTTEYMLDALIQ